MKNPNQAYNLKDVFESALQRYSERIALRSGRTGETMTYGDLDEESNAVANALVDRGIEIGDRVGLLMSNRFENVISDVAIVKTGAVKVPLNPMVTYDDYHHFFTDADIVAVVCGPEFHDIAARLLDDVGTLQRVIAIPDGDEALPEPFEAFQTLRDEGNREAAPAVHPSPDDPAIHGYTGGTTGQPKGVAQSHQSMSMMCYAHIIGTEITGDDQVLLMTPLSHSAMAFLWTSLLAGATVVVRDGFDVVDTLSDIEEYGVTWTFMVPTMLYRMLDHDDVESADLSSLETFVYGAAPMTTNRLEEAHEEFGRIFKQIYGQTEIPNLITTFDKQEHQQALEAGDEERLSSAGQPTLMADVKIMDVESGEEQPVGEVGEIVATAPFAMDGYHELPEETAETVTDGWIHTGDVGRFDEEGYLYLLDRTSDIIITGGMNVYSTEVAETIDEHPAVNTCAVIGVPDDKWGEAVTAVVVPREEASPTESEIIEFAGDRLAAYEKPKRVEFREALPTTPYGKIDTKALREPYWEEESRDIA